MFNIGGALAGGGENADMGNSSPMNVGLIVGLSVTLDGGESAVEPSWSLVVFSGKVKLKFIDLGR